MKQIILFIFLLFSFTSIQSQSKEQRKIITNYITAHNDGTSEAIIHFINQNYTPSYLKKIDLNTHVNFYKNIIEEFDVLNFDIYKTVEQLPNRVVIHLIKEHESILTNHIEPTEILVLELDQAPNNSKFLEKGLGLGSLLCVLKK